MKTVFVVNVHDRDHNNLIVNSIICIDEITAEDIKIKLDNDPKYKLPCYYTIILEEAILNINDPNYFDDTYPDWITINFSM